MSKTRLDLFTCPQCRKPWKVQIWESVNVTLEPELREKVLSAELWNWKCPHCGHQMHLQWGTVYHDMEHKFMIIYKIQDDDITPETKYAKLELPGMLAGQFDDCTIRTVYDFHSFLERIELLEKELDDIAIEHMRYSLSHFVYPEIAARGDSFFFHAVQQSQNLERKYGEMVFHLDNSTDGQPYTIEVPMQVYYEHKYAVENDSRFQLNGNTCVDQEWIEQQLKRYN